MDRTQELHNALITETRRRLIEESMPRIRKCVAELTQEQLWSRPNENSNAVGNLILHLNGNVKQWVLTGIGGEADDRERQAEFDERGPVPTDEMMSRLEETMTQVDELLDQLTPDDLLKQSTVQGYTETGLSILVHVVEHFSYHVGQITYITKAIRDIDLGYYADEDLDVTS